MIEVVAGAARETVGVRDGRWRAAVPRDVRLGFEGIVLGGRRAVARGSVAESGEVLVSAVWREASLLHVRASATGEDLADVELRSPRRGGRPGDASSASVGVLRSPIDLDRALGEGRRGRSRLDVRAPGRAWTRVEVDHERGGDVFVALELGGALRVDVRGAVPAAARLRVARCDGDEEFHVQGGNSVTLEDLAVGRWRIELLSDGVVRGSATAEVVAGATARASVGPEPEPELVPLRGRVVGAEAWGAEAPAVTVRALGGPWIERTLAPAELRRAPGGAWRFDVGRVPAGRYALSTDDPAARVERLVAAESGEVVLALPPPATVLVRVEDERGEPVPWVESIEWAAGALPEPGGPANRRAQREPSTDLFHVCAPEGLLGVRAAGRGLVGRNVVPVSRGTQQVALVMRVERGFELALLDRGAPVACDDLETVTRSLRGEGRVALASTAGDRIRVLVTRPGTYRFRAPSIAGFAAPPEQVVVVPEAGVIEHAIALTRL